MSQKDLTQDIFGHNYLENKYCTLSFGWDIGDQHGRDQTKFGLIMIITGNVIDIQMSVIWQWEMDYFVFYIKLKWGSAIQYCLIVVKKQSYEIMKTTTLCDILRHYAISSDTMRYPPTLCDILRHYAISSSTKRRSKKHRICYPATYERATS